MLDTTKLSLSMFLRKLLSRENFLALALCLLVIALLIATASLSPEWIYQGF